MFEIRCARPIFLFMFFFKYSASYAFSSVFLFTKSISGNGTIDSILFCGISPHTNPQARHFNVFTEHGDRWHKLNFFQCENWHINTPHNYCSIHTIHTPSQAFSEFLFLNNKTLFTCNVSNCFYSVFFFIYSGLKSHTSCFLAKTTIFVWPLCSDFWSMWTAQFKCHEWSDVNCRLYLHLYNEYSVPYVLRRLTTHPFHRPHVLNEIFSSPGTLALVPSGKIFRVHDSVLAFVCIFSIVLT